ncbi:hypothetical protein HEK616_40600 [Streptomyces nigrescens]|uniref:Uncharacterized protein n=1 Tax=Streptomyces nigrescens TaxID=1920 RepID=A0ABM7ZW55_STRNI|nr:hypothetical protein [Streptomyces nigrescens]BDM70573.1 hypothetical protein HEK616_40600 [Streptomyces nigrescens]
MTFGELIRALNTVPITAHSDTVAFLDVDAADAFDIRRVDYSESEGVVWLCGDVAD